MLLLVEELRDRIRQVRDVFADQRQVLAHRLFHDLTQPEQQGASPVRRQRHWVHVPEFRYVRRCYEVIAQLVDAQVLDEARDLVGVHPISCIIAVVMYTRLVPKGVDSRTVGIADAAVVIHGMHQAFYIDTETVSFKFLPVFGVRGFCVFEELLMFYVWQYLLENILDNENCEKVLSVHLIFSLLQIAFQFFFHYEQALLTFQFGLENPDEDSFARTESKVLERSRTNFGQFDIPAFLWKMSNKYRNMMIEFESSPAVSSHLSLESGFADMFVNENVEFVKALHNETAILGYIQHFVRFKKWKLTHWTENKLQVLLYQLSVPGSPLYTPRIIRHASRLTFYTLYPNGKRSRWIVNLLFRLLQPQYLPSSVYYWFKSSFTSVIAWFSRSNIPQMDESSSLTSGLNFDMH